MKLTAGQISGFLSAPPASVRVFLFYGPDSGLAHERAESLASKLVRDKLDPFAFVSLSGAALGSDEALFYDNMASLVLGGGRRLLRVYQATESNASALKSFLADPPLGDSVALIEAGDLEKRSKLRALCETDSPFVAAIPCYIEDAAARQRTIAAHFEAHTLRASRDVLRLLADLLPPDRMAMRSELEKLSLYALGQSDITIEAVRAVVADSGGAEIDDLVQAIASGDASKAMTLLDHLFAEQVSSVALLRALQRHLLRLQLARCSLDAGASAQEAIKKLSPPVFWKAVEPMTKQLHRWTAQRLESRLGQLLDAEAVVKRTGTPDPAFTAQLLLNIAAKG